MSTVAVPSTSSMSIPGSTRLLTDLGRLSKADMVASVSLISRFAKISSSSC